MTDKQISFLDLTVKSAEKEALKKLVFSKPKQKKFTKVSARLVAHRGQRFLAFEYCLPSGTVSQKNISIDRLREESEELFEGFAQANLITALTDVEWKISSSGKEALLGADRLLRRLSGNSPDFEAKIESLDKKKNYILSGSEPFLIKLGISDKGGRVHDKKQGKFRQINRFLEHIEDVYCELPEKDELLIYDLCCGKSYLSFAVYHYFTEIKKRNIKMLGVDLKSDVIEWCSGTARELGYGNMTFISDDIRNTPRDDVDMVISLHACDIATDIVLDTAVSLGAKIILSTPCCHRYLRGKIKSQDLKFVTDYPHISNKLCEAITDSLRLEWLKAEGYSVCALELTDPDDTPKNTLLRAIKRSLSRAEIDRRKALYKKTLIYLFGDKADEYLKDI